MSRIKRDPSSISISLYIFLGILTLISAFMFGIAELRAVQNRINILPLIQNYQPISCEAISENEGKLIHIDCPLHKLHVFRAPVEFSWNLRPFRGVFLEMKVEMFQWVLRSKLMGLSFGGEWNTNLVDSKNYPFIFYNSHINPDFFPNINGAGRSFATEIYGGDFRLNKKHFLEFHSKMKLPLIDDQYYKPPIERPPATVSYTNTHVYNDYLYTGNPKSPKIGDLRISFWGSTATHVSAIAKQQLNHKDGITDLVPFIIETTHGMLTTHNNTVTELIYEGDYTPKEMFRMYASRHNGGKFIIWSIRIIFEIFLTLFIAFTHRIMDYSIHVAILPLALGSVFLALSITSFICTPLWLLCDILHAIIFGIISLISMIIGLLIWYFGTKYMQSLTDEMIQLAPLHERRDNNITKHFYQPV